MVKKIKKLLDRKTISLQLRNLNVYFDNISGSQYNVIIQFNLFLSHKSTGNQVIT